MTEPRWKARGRTVAQLIDELAAFGNPQLEVRISVDAGATSLPISLVTRRDGRYAVLENWQAAPSVVRHGFKQEADPLDACVEAP
jgi:hypothetical protein